MPCWDLNSTGICDTATEDKDGNGTCEATDCQGVNGGNGVPGAAGYNSLVALTPEPAGSNCASGGTKIQTGLDSNSRGVLDLNEVTQTQYVCNGSNASGAGGASGAGRSTSTGGAETGGTPATGGGTGGPAIRPLVATGVLHTCAILSSGAMQCWGDNTWGQLGNGLSAKSLVPVTVTGF